jgi:hypothetical protein
MIFWCQELVALMKKLQSKLYHLRHVVTVSGFFCSNGLWVHCIWKCQLQNNVQTQNFAFLCISPSATLQMLEEAHGKAATKKTHVYVWYKRFHDGHRNVNNTNYRQWLTSTKTLNMFTILCKVHSGDISRSRNISWKHSEEKLTRNSWVFLASKCTFTSVVCSKSTIHFTPWKCHCLPVPISATKK